MDRGHIECVKAILAYPNQLGLQGLKPALDISRGNEFTEITTVLEKAHERLVLLHSREQLKSSLVQSDVF